ncbi:MAG: beta-xylosidase [Bacteroidetes bacterium]|nr:MAG: beta-xylosidase [Bacteroidota bacterium]
MQCWNNPYLRRILLVRSFITLKQLAFFFLSLIFFPNVFSQQKDSVHIKIRLEQTTTERKPLWAWFGYDEPNYTYMKDGKKLLSEISDLSPVPVYVRTHHLLVTGDGTAALKWGSTNAYTEDAYGNPVYNWAIVDSIFDAYIKLGMKPLAQIGFMPEALSIHPEPYRHHWNPKNKHSTIFTGWAYPPKDYNKWAELVYQWVEHCVARYSATEVASWYWEVWNEPDIQYWKGTLQEYCKLYDFAAGAVKRALPTARIGGAEVTGGGAKYLDTFIRHCLYEKNYATGTIGSPLDVVTFHAKGSPVADNNTIVMGISNQLRNIRDNFTVIASYPQLKNVPVIIGEFDPEGCAACGMATHPANAYRNGTMYSSYEAASFARLYELAEKFDINLIGAVTWAFEFENQPWFYGYRDLATNGVDKPVLNVFRMFGLMKGKSVFAQSDHQYALENVIDSGIRKPEPDVGVFGAGTDSSATVMIWNYHDVDRKDVTANIDLNIGGIHATQVRIVEYRIDDNHSNAYMQWKRMGSPQAPTSKQVAELQTTGQLQSVDAEKSANIKNGSLVLNIDLPEQGISLVKLSW